MGNGVMKEKPRNEKTGIGITKIKRDKLKTKHPRRSLRKGE